MQAKTSSTSAFSRSYSDSQFCLTGRQISSDLSDAFKASDAIVRPRTRALEAEKTMVEGRCSEVESDTDSGKGTILSDNLESPVRDSPLSFPPVHRWKTHGLRFPPPQRDPNGRTDTITDHEAVYREEDYAMEDTAADAYDSFPVSPTSEASYDHGLESPSAVSGASRSRRMSHRGIFGSVEGSHRVQSAEANSAEELSGSRFSFVDPGFPGASDRNNNNLPVPVRLPPGRYDPTEMVQRFANVTNASDQGRVSHNKSGYDLYDSNETKRTFYNNNNDNNSDNNDNDNDRDDNMRQQLKAKCQYLFGSRGSDFGSRVTNYSRFGGGQDVGRSYSDFRQFSYDCDAPTMHRGRSIFTGSTTQDHFRSNDDDVTGSSSCPLGYHDTIGGYHGNRRQGNNVRYLSLKDPVYTALSTEVRKDWFPAPNPSEDRGNAGHQSKRHLRAKQQRWQETAFNSTVDEIEGTEGPAVFPSSHPPSAGEYLRSRSVPYGRDPVELPYHPGFEASSVTLPRQPKVPWGNRGGDQGLVQTVPVLGPDNTDRHRRRNQTVRRWTNPGPSEDVDPVPPSPNPDPKPSRRVQFDLSIPKRQQRSTTSIAPDDRVGGSRPAKFDLEMVSFDPSKSASVPSTPSTRTDGTLSRGSSFPDPDSNGSPKLSSPGISFIQKIRSRLTGRKRSGSSGTIVSSTDEQFGATARHQDAPNDQRHQGTSARDDGAASDDVVPVVKATGMLLRFNSLQESTDDDVESTAGQAKNFSTLQHQKPNPEIQTRSRIGGENTVKRMPTSTISHVNTAAAEAAGSVVGCESAGQTVAGSSAVATTLLQLDELASLVDAHASRTPSTGDRTISEADFDCYRSAMIDSLRDFIENCKLMVIGAPASSSGFADDVDRCCRLLQIVVVGRYEALVDCSSLPADRGRFARGVGAVVASFRETVSAAAEAAGLTAKHPAVRALRARSGRLVGDLTELMRMVRGMNYNGISRRF